MHQWNNDTFQSEVVECEQPVVVGFISEQCSSSKRMIPILQDLHKELDGQALVGTVDVHDAAEIAQKYGARSTPLTCIFVNGKAIQSYVGLRQKVELSSTVKSYL